MDFKEKLISDQQKTIESLSHEISALRDESARREIELNEQIKRLNQEIANLSETLRTIAGGRFAPSSESSKARQIEGQLNLDFFNEAEYHSADNTPEPTAAEIETDEVKAEKKRSPRGTREVLYHNLLVREEIYQLPAEEKACGYCNTEFTYLCKEIVREEIRIIPAQVERVQIVRECYICPGCKEDDVTEIIKAVVPQPLLKHSLASPSIVAHVSKVCECLTAEPAGKRFCAIGSKAGSVRAGKLGKQYRHEVF
ncbi:MAG: IS66 family transposase zinc-finger binding domain-containing protein [Lachnospiraceae bacterium]